MKTIIITEPIYETQVMLVVGGTEPNARAEFMKWYASLGGNGETLWRDSAHAHIGARTMEELNAAAFKDPLPDGACSYLPSEGRIYGFWVGPNAAKSFSGLATVISHEVMHIAVAVMDHVGIAVSTEHSEACAYYTQYLMREILKSITPWRRELPDESGLWWWWNEDPDSLPIPVDIMFSGTSGTHFASLGQYGWTHAQEVSEMAGWWMRLHEPELPRV